MLNRDLFIFSAICGMFFVLIETNVLESADNEIVTELVSDPPSTAGMRGNQITLSLDHGRGHLHKGKKIFKHIYPILMAVLLAKLIVVPLILKLLIAATSSAFVMSKVAVVTSAIVALSWLLGATRERAKLQIVYPPNGSKKFYGGWNVKYSPNHAPNYGDWYDNNGGEHEHNEKSFFL